MIGETIDYTMKTEKLDTETAEVLADDWVQQLVEDIAAAELLDMCNDELSNNAMENLLFQVLSTDVVKEAISEEE